MTVYEKIATVMKSIDYLKKDGFVTTGRGAGYRAMTDEKVLSTIRPKLIDAGLIMIPVKMTSRRADEQIQSQDGNVRVNRITDVEVTYRIINVDDSTDFVEVVSAGTGVDTQDKGIGKAMTYAKKYALLNTLLIPSGDDPDRIASDRYTDILELGEKDDEIENKLAEEEDKNMLVNQIITLAESKKINKTLISKEGYKGKSWDALTYEQLREIKKEVAKL